MNNLVKDMTNSKIKDLTGVIYNLHWKQQKRKILLINLDKLDKDSNKKNGKNKDKLNKEPNNKLSKKGIQLKDKKNLLTSQYENKFDFRYCLSIYDYEIFFFFE